VGRVRDEKRRRRSEKRKSQKKEDAGARKGRKVAIHSQGRLAKAAGAEPSGQMRDKKLQAAAAQSTCASEKGKKTSSRSEHFWKCTPSLREAHFHVRMRQTHQGRNTFGSCDVKKVHAIAVLARSKFRNQNVQTTPASEHFWKLRC